MKPKDFYKKINSLKNIDYQTKTVYCTMVSEYDFIKEETRKKRKQGKIKNFSDFQKTCLKLIGVAPSVMLGYLPDTVEEYCDMIISVVDDK